MCYWFSIVLYVSFTPCKDISFHGILLDEIWASCGGGGGGGGQNHEAPVI